MILECPTTRAEAERRLSALHAEYSRPLLSYLIGLTGGERPAAEDLLQETMIRAWKSLAAVPDEREHARRWLFTVARNVAIDAIRMRRVRPAETPLLDFTRRLITADSTEMVLAVDTLLTAFGGLSPAHRTILAELYFQGRTTVETANRLGVPVGTVKSRAHYALHILRRALLGTA
ncbi:sigma-70 family RNA polymerase sigma factor [Actinoplanes sp. HUAS TT8]|uniref:sigma-70 family RNA polymerase sigma factor n=1 Tax=Actinoplanes sp. HUAS TT8 TaxID=3447453 RepID=UPI003F524EFF